MRTLTFKALFLSTAVAVSGLAGVAFAPVSAQAAMTKMVGGAPMYPSKNIIQNAVNSKDHTTLVAAVKAAGLVDTLEGPGPFTVFAPTNEAFAKLPKGTVDTLLKPENKAMLTKVLTAHVVAGKLSAHTLMRDIRSHGGKYNMTTVSGDALTAEMKGHSIYIIDEFGRCGAGDDPRRQPVERRYPCREYGSRSEIRDRLRPCLSNPARLRRRGVRCVWIPHWPMHGRGLRKAHPDHHTTDSSGMRLPDPTVIHPMPGQARCGFLRNLVTRPTIEIGDFTYYDDPLGPERFEEECVLYHFDFIGDRLVIGKFCAIAANTRFIMNGANHDMRGFSTYPFGIFGRNWHDAWDQESIKAGFRGDTIVGNDVWFGMEATVMPGVKIGDGAIIAAKSVIARDVPPYAVVAGNPGRIIRTRFDEPTVSKLLAIAWWDWPVDKVARNVDAIASADISRLERAT